MDGARSGWKVHSSVTGSEFMADWKDWWKRHRRSVVRRRTVAGCLVVLTGLVAPWFPATGYSGEVTFPQARPEELGMTLPSAPPKAIEGMRVVVPGEGDKPTVARVYLQVGDYYVVTLPTGALISLPIQDATPTDRPFEPWDKKKLADHLIAGQFPGFQTRHTRRYLYVYNTSEEFRKATSQILETIYPALHSYFRRLGIAVCDPEFPLVVVMFRTQEEFQKYRQTPDGMVAYYNGLSNHVVMFEQSKLAQVAPDLAFKQAVSTIAHEGVHQVLHNIGVQQRLSRWPIWFSEGLAEYFAPTELGKGVRWKGVGLVNDLRMHELSEFYKARKGESTQGQLLSRAIEAQSLDSLGYATSWALIHYLAKFERKAFQDSLVDLAQLQPLQSIPPGSLFAKHFSGNYPQKEEQLMAHLHSLPFVNPVLNQTHYVLMIADPRQVFVTSSPVDLQRLHKEHAKPGKFLIQAFPNRATAELFSQNWLRRR
jgi:hypothetical protein